MIEGLQSKTDVRTILDDMVSEMDAMLILVDFVKCHDPDHRLGGPES